MWRWDKEDLGTHQLPAVRGAHCLFGGKGLTAAYIRMSREGLTAAYVRMSRGGVDCSLRTVHMSRRGVWLAPECCVLVLAHA